MREKRNTTRIDYAKLDDGNLNDSVDAESTYSRTTKNGSKSSSTKGQVKGPHKSSKAASSSVGAGAGGTAAGRSPVAGKSAPASAETVAQWADKYQRLLQRFKGQLTRVKTADSFIDAYEGAGWKGARLEQIKPEGEIISALQTIVDAKRKMRALLVEIWAQDAEHDKYSQNITGENAPGAASAAAALQPVLSLLTSEQPKGAKEASRVAAELSSRLEVLVGKAGSLAPGHKEDEGESIDAEDIACSACGVADSTDDNDILLCDYAGCGRAYHMGCCVPPLTHATLPPEDVDWVCARCACIVACISELNELLSCNYDAIASVFADVEKEHARVAIRQAAYDLKRKAAVTTASSAAAAAEAAAGGSSGAAVDEDAPIAQRRKQRAAAVSARATDEWRALTDGTDEAGGTGSASGVRGAGSASSAAAAGAGTDADAADDDTVRIGAATDGDGDDDDDDDGDMEPYNEEEDEDFEEADASAEDDEEEEDGGDGMDGDYEGGEDGEDEEIAPEDEGEEDIDAELAALRAEAGLDSYPPTGSSSTGAAVTTDGDVAPKLRRRKVVDYVTLAAKLYGDKEDEGEERGAEGGQESASAAASSSAAPGAASQPKKRQRKPQEGGVLAAMLKKLEGGDDDSDGGGHGGGRQAVDPEQEQGRAALAAMLTGGLADDEEDDEDWGARKKRARKAPAKPAAAAEPAVSSDSLPAGAGEDPEQAGTKTAIGEAPI